MVAATRDIIFMPTRSGYRQYFPDFEGLLKPDDIYSVYETNTPNIKSFVHLTHAAKSILGSKTVYSSAGGLLGGVYVVPVIGDALHGLGQFIAEQESVLLAGNTMRDGFMFMGAFRIGSVDYLGLGAHYEHIYNETPALKSVTLSDELARATQGQKLVIRRSSQLLLEGRADEAVDGGINGSAIFQVLYFEILMEYLFRKHALVTRPDGIQELDVASAKATLFLLNPELSNGFSLKRVTCQPSSVDEHFRRTKPYLPGTFIKYLLLQLPRYIARYLVTEEDWRGHTLFRQFNHRVLLEQLLAIKLWEEARVKKINAVSYRLPKGEFALLPIKNVDAKQVRLSGLSAEVLADLNLSVGHLHATTRKGTLRSPYSS